MLNFTFKDEENGTLLNTSVELDITYWLTNKTANVTYSFDSSTNFKNFTFCGYPNYTAINVTYDLLYTSTNYPQRRYSPHRANGNSTLTNTTTSVLLRLLNTADGMYVRFVTVDSSNTPIDDVDVLMERQISSIWRTIERETTDDSGLATFWVNPDKTYRFTFAKSGYDTQIKTLRPTSSEIYYIDMGGEAGGYPTTNFSRYTGINWTILPLARVLNNDTAHNFTFRLNSTNQTVQSFSFQLFNSSSIITKNGTGNGGILSYSYNVGNNTNVTGKFRWYISGELTEQVIVWEIETIYEGLYSIKNFIDNFKAYSVGDLDNKTRLLLAFIIVFAIVAGISFFSGVYSYDGLIIFIMLAVGIIYFLGFIQGVQEVGIFVVVEILGAFLLVWSFRKGV
jgi:hypothetical protein